MRSIKKDHFFRERGSVCRILRLSCAVCGQELLIYQKDGKGTLYRIYLNRILAPENLACLQDEVSLENQLSNLACICGKVIGVPMLHYEGRLAFRLLRGTYGKSIFKD